MRLRAPDADDAPAVLAVIVARDIADLGIPDLTLEDLREEWGVSELDLAADARIAESDGGGIVGYAIVRDRGTLAVVAPEREGEGTGTRLLRWAEGRERERGRPLHRQWVAASNASGRALLLAAGYEFVRSYWRLVRELDGFRDRVAVPAGMRLRALEVARDARALHELDAASFATVAAYEPESFVAFSEEHLRAHDLDPELSCVAEHKGQIVGFLLARRWQSENAGYVDLLAVHPSHQRRGLGSALLLGAFARFAAAGLREAQLGVASDNARALQLYERVGMRARFQVDTYERAVPDRRG